MKHDPKRQYCQCGYSWRPGTFEKVMMLLKGGYVKTCPRCQCKLHLVLYNFVVCKKREQVDNKELWKNG